MVKGVKDVVVILIMFLFVGYFKIYILVVIDEVKGKYLYVNFVYGCFIGVYEEVLEILKMRL